MFLIKSVHARVPKPSVRQIACSSRRYLGTKVSDPLRILFCGSDKFSIASLGALNQEWLADRNLIESIHVVCRPGKRVGRGLKKIREVPIAAAAQELGLPLHQIDTFTGWQPPTPRGAAINLVIAVSFGLLIPSRILSAAKYGGLNVHPSLLPDFRGAAPLHHTLLEGCRKTGVSLQALHPSRFDHGTILLRTSDDGLSIPDPDNITVPQLTDFLAPTAADLLIRGLRDRVFVPPLEALGPATQNHGTASFERPAPKIRPEDRHIDWRTWSADQILRRNRVLGRLWNTIDASLPTGEQRILWSSGFTKSDLDMGDYAAGVGAISPSGSAIFIRTVDGQTLTAGRVIMEGSWEKDAGVVMRKARLLDECRGVGIGIEEQGYAMLRSPFT